MGEIIIARNQKVENKIDISYATVTLNSTPLVYDGTVKTQVITVSYGGQTLIENTDYVVVNNAYTNAGNYTLSVQGIGNYEGQNNVNWSIVKATGSISINPSSMTIIGATNEIGTATITVVGDGTITAVNDDSNVATVYLSTQVYSPKISANVRTGPGTSYDALGTTTVGSAYIYLGTTSGTWHKIYYDGQVAWTSQSSSGTYGELIDASTPSVVVTSVGSGSATITVTLDAGTNYTGSSATIDVSVVTISPTLSDNTPEQIKAAAQAGIASTLWSVGDKTAPISVGAVGNMAATSACAFILGFDHNSSVEGTGIHFQFGKTTSGTDIAFCDSGYNSSQTSGTWFNMNNSDSNSGGWRYSRMRSTVRSAFKAALPSAWQSAIKGCKKWTYITGNNVESAAVIETTDDIFLLAEKEVFGSISYPDISYANSSEGNKQEQYAYYANGNSKVKYKHNATTTTCLWWLRSVDTGSSSNFVYVNAGGKGNNKLASISMGFAPGFMVG